MAKSPSLDIDYIAKLARLKLTGEEEKRFSQQLTDVLDHVEKLKELDLKDVSPTFQTTGVTDVVREDRADAERVLTPDEALSNAGQKVRGFFRVPKVL